MKTTLLALVQSILSDMDSENINSISDSVEAGQVASIVRDTFYNLIATRSIPEHSQLLRLAPASDSAFPTHFSYGTETKVITSLWYKDSQDYYREVNWVEPMDFLIMTDKINSDYQEVFDKSGSTSLRIVTNKNPTFYTSFDDNWVVMNSFDNTVDDTLKQSKVRAYGTVYPTFSLTDSYIPDIDATLFPYLLAESKSTAMSLLKGQTDPKIDQAARRQKSYMQNDQFKTKKQPDRPHYGRR